MNDAGKATDATELERQIMSWNEPKNEREWWALREIERLRAAALKAAKVVRGLKNDSGSPSWNGACDDCAEAIENVFLVSESRDQPAPLTPIGQERLDLAEAEVKQLRDAMHKIVETEERWTGRPQEATATIHTMSDIARQTLPYLARHVKPNDPGRLVPPHGSGPDNQ